MAADRSIKGWTSYWEGPSTLYVSDRHKSMHYALIARDIATHIGSPDARVLDYGCGEALSAPAVAARCRTLVLSDAAVSVRDGLVRRFAHLPNITVVGPAGLHETPAASFDVIIANSVVQYVAREDMPRLLGEWHRLLAPDGRLILGDIIPASSSALTDAVALLRFGHANGFLGAACTGLLRTCFSQYRSTRAKLGLLQFSEGEIIDLVRAHGFAAERGAFNIGHNQARMTIIARKRA